MQAVIYHPPKQAFFVNNHPIPHLRDKYILVRVKAVALNPTDWKHVEQDLPKPGGLLGVDYAGVVVAVGSKVTASFRPGDRIAGFVHGGNYSQPEDGAFAEYILARGDIQAHAPPHLSWAEVATLGTGILTVGQGLFEMGYGLGLRMPGDNTTAKPDSIDPSGAQPSVEDVLIYGGSTASGSLGIQFAKAAGYRVLTTCSTRNNELVRQRGADLVFDYHDPDCGAKINAATSNQLQYAWDCVGDEQSYATCTGALTSVPGVAKYSTIVKTDFPNARDDVEHSITLGYVGLGEDFEKFGMMFTDNEKHREFQCRWLPVAWKLVADGMIQPHPQRESRAGLEGVRDGLETLKMGDYNGEKLVYLLDAEDETGEH